ncbi:MAG: autotransporter-associated beta strand repeat-containing protein [Terrimicrobiaceae bacterium]
MKHSLLCLAILVVAATAPARAADFSWNSSSAGADWSVPGSWSVSGSDGDGIPDADDTVVTPDLFGVSDVNGNFTIGALSYNSASSWSLIRQGTPSDQSLLTINGDLTKEGSGTLLFRQSDSTMGIHLNVLGNITMTGGTLAFAQNNTTDQSRLSVGGSVTITNAILSIDNNKNVSIGGVLTLNGTGRVNTVGQGITGSGSNIFAVGGLSSADSTTVISNNTNPTSGYTSVLELNNASGTSTFAGAIKNGTASTNVLSVEKNGVGTQVFSGAGNIYTGTTTVNAGTLLVNNTTGSGSGTGAVAVNGTGTLGGTGFINPGGTNGISVASGGFLAPGTIVPGASIGTLTLNLGSTTGTVNLTGGGDFKFELGTVGVTIGASGTSDLLVLTGASASDVAFGGGNNIDLLGTATAEGYYKLFDTSLDATTWTGLTLGGATTGGNLIAGGLSASNYGGGFSGELILADGTAGTSLGDIYLHVVPEPSTVLLSGLGLTVVLFGIRRRQNA